MPPCLAIFFFLKHGFLELDLSPSSHVAKVSLADPSSESSLLMDLH